MKNRICFFGSERLPNRQARRKARQAIKLGLEPSKVYRSGKFWTD